MVVPAEVEVLNEEMGEDGVAKDENADGIGMGFDEGPGLGFGFAEG